MISEDTGISIGVMVIAVGSMITCTVFIVRNLGSLRGRIDALTARLTTVESEHYTISQAEVHALRMAIENPGLQVPDPRNPGKIIQVRRGEGWHHAKPAESV